MSATDDHPYLQERFALLDVAQALADVDEPGCWWTLGPEARARYEAMAIVAIERLGSPLGGRASLLAIRETPAA
jgi:hypothetical protein